MEHSTSLSVLVQRRLQCAVAFLNKHRSLWSYHFVDAILHDVWASLPNAWRQPLQQAPLQELLQAVTGHPPPHWPDELREFFVTCKSLSCRNKAAVLNLSQQGVVTAHKSNVSGQMTTSCCSSNAPIQQQDLQQQQQQQRTSLYHWLSADGDPVCSQSQQQQVTQPTAPKQPLQQRQRQTAKGIKPKKQYEIQQLAALVAQLAAETAADVVVDLGAGKGHLACFLAQHYGLTVLAVEADSNLTNTTIAAAAAKVSNTATQQQQPGRGRVLSVSCRLDSATAQQQLQQMLTTLCQARTNTSNTCTAAFDDLPAHAAADTPNPSSSNSSNSNSIPRVLLVGLHACGDLSAVLLHLFKHWDHVVAAVSIGCCYNLLTESPCTVADHCSNSSSGGTSSSSSSSGGTSSSSSSERSVTSNTAIQDHRSAGQCVAVCSNIKTESLQHDGHCCRYSSSCSSYGFPMSVYLKRAASAHHHRDQKQHEGCCQQSSSTGDSSNSKVTCCCQQNSSTSCSDTAIHLGWHGRSLACQAAERTAAIGATGAQDVGYSELSELAAQIKRHSLRAALQAVLPHLFPELELSSVKVGRSSMKRKTNKKTASAAAQSQQSTAIQAEQLGANAGQSQQQQQQLTESLNHVLQCSKEEVEQYLIAALSQLQMVSPPLSSPLAAAPAPPAAAAAAAPAAEDQEWEEDALDAAGSKAVEPPTCPRDTTVAAATSAKAQQVECLLSGPVGFHLVEQLQRLPVLWCIRLALAPVHETVLLLDRWLYVLEPQQKQQQHAPQQQQQHQCGKACASDAKVDVINAELVQLFDTVISPRSMALVCVKEYVKEDQMV